MTPVDRGTRAQRRVLMIAFHFPPLAGSSGIQRTLRFAQHLPEQEWAPLVLSIDPRAYERTSPDLDAEVPASIPVHRAIGFDAARQLAWRGRYAAWTARPDRWMSWRFDGVRQGLKMIKAFQPQVIWSTYPIATAHVIGAELQRRSGLPWVADFRDPMAQDDYPTDPATWRQYKAIETRAAQQARLNLFTTPSALRLYRERYPAAAERMALLENGYDEESFAQAEASAAPLNPGCLTLLHSGIVYGSERDPTQLFAALAMLRDKGVLSPGQLKIRFRAAVHEELLHTLARQYGVTDYLEVCQPVPYRQALSEMLRADALLVLQAQNCNAQIPAKIYEYLRAQRPILCLSHPDGDTEAALTLAGVRAHARLDDPESIARVLQSFLADHACGQLSAYLANAQAVAASSRRGRALSLAQHLDRITEAS
jgi:glycosyltransferase involved in cell wall biosynthesis